MNKDEIIYVILAFIVGYLIFLDDSGLLTRVKFIIFNNLLLSLIGGIFIILLIQQWQKN